MDNILRLDRPARRRLTKLLRKTKDHQTALRYLMILKLDQGLSRQQVARDLRCAPATVVGAAKRYLADGEDGLLDQRACNGQPKVDERFLAELRRVLLSVPTEFGWQRPTWTRELLCLELEQRGFPKVAVCTMGRALCAVGARLGAPKPFVACPWNSLRRKRKIAALRRLARNATASEPVFFEDESRVGSRRIREGRPLGCIRRFRLRARVAASVGVLACSPPRIRTCPIKASGSSVTGLLR